MQTYLVHKSIHNERCTSQIARVLHKGDKEVQNHNVGQKHYDTAHTTDDSVADHIFEYAVGQPMLKRRAEECYALLNPLLRIGSQAEGAVEHQPHHKYKYRVAEYAVSYDSVDGFCNIFESIVSSGVCFEQCAGNKTSLLIRHCGRYILVCTEVGVQMFSLFLASALPLLEVGARGEHSGNFGIAFEHLHRQISWREALRQLLTVLLHLLVERLHALLDNTLVDVDMAYSLILSLVYGYDCVEQYLYTSAFVSYDREHRQTHHLAEQIVVERCPIALQLVVHT